MTITCFSSAELIVPEPISCAINSFRAILRVDSSRSLSSNCSTIGALNVPNKSVDEPYTALDTQGAELLDAQLDELHGAKTFLVSTHDPQRVRRLATSELSL